LLRAIAKILKVFAQAGFPFFAYGYLIVKPNARGPRTVLLFLDLVASYTRSMFAGMAAYAVEHGPWRFVPVMAPTAVMTAVIHGRGIDGLLARVITQQMARVLSEAKLPVVNVGRVDDNPLPTVNLDDPEVGRIGARYLLQAELPSFAYCGLPWRWYSRSREVGFVETVREAGRTVTVFGGEPYDGQGFDPADQQRHLDGWLGALPKPVGVMACDDLRARDVLEGCHRTGLRVPEEVAVVGAGNDPLICETTEPPLSSVALAAERVGFAAARLLGQLMDGHPAPTATAVIPPVAMVARFSTKVATSVDADVAHAIDFIRDEVHAGITVEDVLRVVPLSRRALEMRFRKALGRSPAGEIRRVRIERAKRLLVETDADMAGVARASGFSSANQLCETFRREAGVSPTRYRRQFRAG
jgi:LacI family transcriptional regulator